MLSKQISRTAVQSGRRDADDNDPEIDDKRPPSHLPRDRPFANVMAVPTSLYPDRYQEVLSSHLQTTAQKIQVRHPGEYTWWVLGLTFPLQQALQRLRRQDAWEHCLYIIIAVVFMVQVIFTAAGGIYLVELREVLPLLYIWQAAAFLLPGIPLVVMYLIDSVRRQGASDFLNGRGPTQTHTMAGAEIPLSNLTFDIPLERGVDNIGTVSGGDVGDRFDSAPRKEMGMGIQVNQAYTTVVETHYVEDLKVLEGEKKRFE